jgi:hypothetical protein
LVPIAHERRQRVDYLLHTIDSWTSAHESGVGSESANSIGDKLKTVLSPMLFEGYWRKCIRRRISVYDEEETLRLQMKTTEAAAHAIAPNAK